MEYGWNFWDRAPVYGMGASEYILGIFIGSVIQPMSGVGHVVCFPYLAQIKETEAILSQADIHISAVQNHYSLSYRYRYSGLL